MDQNVIAINYFIGDLKLHQILLIPILLIILVMRLAMLNVDIVMGL
jgi:hypothetical protein